MISGYVCVRNGIKLDYCFQEAIRSLLPVCDEVVACDSDSDDGTTELLKSMRGVRYLNRPWTNPHREITWWVDWLNWVRPQLSHPVQLQLDADEVLCPKAYLSIKHVDYTAEDCPSEEQLLPLRNHQQIRTSGSRWFHRLNFWGDAKHLAPHGTVCGEQVCRMGLTKLWMPSDEPHPEGLPEIQRRAGWPPNAAPEMRIFHYGFLRKEQALIDKVRVVNGAFFGTFDDRLAKAERDGTPWINEFHFDKPLLAYDDTHPDIAVEWLKQRGYL